MDKSDLKAIRKVLKLIEHKQNLLETMSRLENIIKANQRTINELEKLRSQDLYEKELMLADVDSVVQRSETITPNGETIDERD